MQKRESPFLLQENETMTANVKVNLTIDEEELRRVLDDALVQAEKSSPKSHGEFIEELTRAVIGALTVEATVA